MPRMQFKTIAEKISISEYIRNHSMKYKGDEPYYGYSVAIELSSNPKSYVTLKQNKDHISFTVIDRATGNIVNELFYNWIYEDPEPYIQFHSELLDFYDWYCKACTIRLSSNNINDFINYKNLGRLLMYYDLYKTFNVIFRERIFDNITDLKTPNELKDLIINFSQYKKLYELSLF